MKRLLIISFSVAITILMIGRCSSDGLLFKGEGQKSAPSSVMSSDTVAVATFAGGCFWCMEAHLEKVEGVTSVTSGYTGGVTENPTYYDVGSGKTGHVEAVEVVYDPRRVGYMKLLDVFWKSHDPTDAGGQFADRGSMYQSAVFYHTFLQRAQILASLKNLENAGVFSKPIITAVRPAVTFYVAEEYHQDYYLKNPAHYNSYSAGSGRDGFLEKTWDGMTWTAESVMVTANSIPEDSVLRALLTPMQYKVTQEMGTEPPFNNEYWDNHLPGIYVDIVSGEPLFSSTDKFDSGTGWPSFTRPLSENFVTLHQDLSHGMNRTEVRSAVAGSHLGHLFNDGPAPTNLRYCMDSASLLFIPAERLVSEGYGEYAALFMM